MSKDALELKRLDTGHSRIKCIDLWQRQPPRYRYPILETIFSLSANRDSRHNQHFDRFARSKIEILSASSAICGSHGVFVAAC